MRIIGKGAYSGSCYARINVKDPYDVASYYARITRTVFIGDDLTNPPISIYSLNCGGTVATRLVQGEDYSFEGWFKFDVGGYSPVGGAELTEPGTYYMKIAGKEPYGGELYVSTELKSIYDLSGYLAGIVGLVYTDSDSENLTVRIARQDAEGNYVYLVQGKDFEIEDNWYIKRSSTNYVLLDGSPEVPGMYQLKANGLGDYAGSSVYVSVNVRAANDIASCTVKADSFVLDGGDPSNPSVTVQNSNGDLLTQGVDYTVKGWYQVGTDKALGYVGEAPIEAGQYYLLVTGINDYTGSSYYPCKVVNTAEEAHEHVASPLYYAERPTAKGETGSIYRYCTECGETLTTIDVLYGDLDYDGKFTVSDLVLLQRYLAGSTYLLPRQQILADVCGDDGVNMMDLVALSKQLLV